MLWGTVMRVAADDGWFEAATGRIEGVFEDATYVVDEDLETYVLTPRGWKSFGVIGSPEFYSEVEFWDRWIALATREEERLGSSVQRG